MSIFIDIYVDDVGIVTTVNDGLRTLLNDPVGTNSLIDRGDGTYYCALVLTDIQFEQFKNTLGFDFRWYATENKEYSKRRLIRSSNILAQHSVNKSWDYSNSENDTDLFVPYIYEFEGFGTDSVFNNKGTIVTVTNLNDSGAGSLRDALGLNYPRTIVFDVSGNIELSSVITVANPYVTILGQTAPNGGICIKDARLIIETHHVIIQHIRFRCGPDTVGPISGVSLEVLYGGNNVVIDHCTMSWSTSQIFNFFSDDPDLPVENCTVQYCILDSPLRNSAFQVPNVSPPGHSYGYGLIAGRYATGFSFHHNLMSHCYARSWQVSSNSHPIPYTFVGDFRNNMIYNYLNGTTMFNGMDVNIIGNNFRHGNNTSITAVFANCVNLNVGEARYYQDDNIVEKVDDSTTQLIINKGNFSGSNIELDEPFETPSVTVEQSATFWDNIKDHIGASLPKRDTRDTTLITEVDEKTGNIIITPDDVGGYPDLTV